MKKFNIVLAGVGGQGILLAAEILGTASIKEGFNVRVSEIHGMAQRGGAVVSHVRIGGEVYAPTTTEGKADIILGLEPLEALRNITFASEKTMVLLNTERLLPGVLFSQENSYPNLQTIIEKIRMFTSNVLTLDAADLAKKAGNILTRNTVMLGGLAATQTLPIKTGNLKEAISELVPKKYLETNLRAFKLGCETVKK
ncbi:MAG: indolepyruvate ferredoxin oxidoreductase subunit beta [Thermoproteota archaeon]|nr:indolepyruvate ferredoxin oxidoreductase subunit beta [Thermoproteota archaeon]